MKWITGHLPFIRILIISLEFFALAVVGFSIYLHDIDSVPYHGRIYCIDSQDEITGEEASDLSDFVKPTGDTFKGQEIYTFANEAYGETVLFIRRTDGEFQTYLLRGVDMTPNEKNQTTAVINMLKEFY